MTDEQEHAPDAATPDVPFPEVATPAAEPMDVAAEFIAAAQEAAGETGVKITETRKRKRSGVATETSAPVVPTVQWSPDGIGTAVAFGANMALVAGEMAPLEEEEEKKVKVVSAMYLNVRWPKAAKFEPEAMIVALLAEILGPRLAAKRIQAQAAAEQETGLGRV